MSQEIQVYKIDQSYIQPLDIGLPDFDAITTALPTGLYTTFRTYAAKTRVIGLRSHMDRLYRPAAEQGVVPVLRHPENLRRTLYSLLQQLDASDARVRLILDTSQDTGSMYVILQAMKPLSPEIYCNGVHVEISSSSREKPTLKRTSFIAESSLERKKVGNGIFEILLTHRLRILEGMTSNFFYIQKGVLGTAGRGVLIGVTRQTLLAIAKEQGIRVSYRALPLNELVSIQEAFITSSSRGVVPVVQVGSSQVGNGNVGDHTARLMHLYEEEVLSLAELIMPS